MSSLRRRLPGTTGTRRSAAARFSIPEVTDLLQEIFDHQYPRFDGEVAADRRAFASPAEAARHLKEKALEFGADIVGICEIEPSDVYRGRVITEKYAIAVGQRMRWREFQVVPSKASAIECLRVYFTLGETVIQLAAYIRSIGYACKVEHPIGDSDLLHIPIGLKAGFGELGRHGSIIHPTLGPLFRMGSVITSIELAIDQPDRCRHRQVLRHRAAPAGSTVRRARFPTSAAPRPARTISATTATSSTPAAAFPTSRSTPTAPSACRSASTTTRSGRAISTARRRSRFRP